MPTCLLARLSFSLLKYFVPVIIVAGMVPKFAHAQSADRVDLFMAERPRALTIYNKYQQDISFDESRLFRPYIPMEVMQYDALLSDNFTHCMIVRVGNQQFYVIKEDEKTPSRIDEAGFNGYLARCTVVADTVRILRDDTVVLSKRIPVSVMPDTLKTGTMLRRLYLKNGRYYVEGIGGSDIYGWTRFSSRTRGRNWDLFERSQATLSDILTADLRAGIESRLQEVNTVLADVFETLNRETGRTLAAPRWQMVVETDRIICLLSDADYVDKFSDSAQYIVNDLDALVRPEGLTVDYVNNRIIITRKP